MKSLLIVLMMCSIVQTSLAKDVRNYVEGDGDLNFICSNKDQNDRPYNTYSFRLLYDENALHSGKYQSLDEIMQAMDGAVVYEISVEQSAFFGSEAKVVKTVIPGCEFAPMKIVIDPDTPHIADLEYRCGDEADKIASGSIMVSEEDEVINSEIQFPNGLPQAMYPLKSKNIALSCAFDFGDR